MGTATVVSGTATLNVTTLPVGTHTGINARHLANANYRASTSGSLSRTVNTSAQAALIASASPSTLTFGAGTSTLSTTGGSGSGAVSYAVGSGPCSVTGNTLSSTGVGTCSVTATKAADANYSAVTSAPISVTIDKAAQAALIASANPFSLTLISGPSTLSTTGGSGTGAVSYTVTSGPCSVTGDTLSTTGVGTCSVTATKAADANYTAITSASVSVTVTQAPQAALIASASPSSLTLVSGPSTLSTTGGSGTGAVSYTVASGPCSVAGSTLSGTGLGTCSVTATKAADGIYSALTSAAVNVNVTRANQTPLTVTASPSGIPYLGTSTLSISGGSGTGALSLSVGAGSCSLSGNTVTSTGTGLCRIVAFKDRDGVYNSVTAFVTIAMTKIDQVPLTVSASPTTIPVLGSTTLSSTGGSGTGALVYVGSCPISGNTMTGPAVGTCSAQALKQPDANYNQALSAAINVTVTQMAQTITFTAPGAQTFTPGGTVGLSATGGASGNPVTFAATTTGVCTSGGANGATVTFVAGGTCSVTASQAGNGIFEAAPDVTQSFGIGQAAQTISFAAPPAQTFAPGGTVGLSATGGASGNPVTFAATTTGVCTTGGTNGATVTFVAAGPAQ